MGSFFQHPVVRRCRVIFRWCRIFVWLVLLTAVAAVAYLHLVGLPDFVKQPMLRKLFAAGIDAKFSNMQLGWGPAILIENAAFSRSHDSLSPRLSAGRAELAIDWKPLLHRQLELRSLDVSDAQLTLPVTLAPGDALVLDKVAIALRFLSNDIVEVDTFRVSFRGVQADLVGAITHASDLQRLNFSAAAANNGAFQARFQQVADIIKRIDFTGTPFLRLEAGVDGRDLNTFHAEMNFTAPASQSPWWKFKGLAVRASMVHPLESGDDPFLRLNWSATNIITPWTRSGPIFCDALVTRQPDSNFTANVHLKAGGWRASLDPAGTNWCGAGRVAWDGRVLLAFSNLAPLALSGKLDATTAQTRWGSAGAMSVVCHGEKTARPPSQPAWGPFNQLAHWTVDCQADVRDVSSPKLALKHALFTGQWRAPQVVINKFNGVLYGGQVQASATLNIDSRELRCSGDSDLDPHSISQLLHPVASNWLRQLAWPAPPKVQAQLRVVLPPWVGLRTNWPTTDTLQIAGEFTAGTSFFNRVKFSAASSPHVTYTNRVWHIWGLHLTRPEGEADLDYRIGELTQEYRFIVDSKLDPNDVLPLAAPNHPHLLDHYAFPHPPVVHAEVSGNWRVPGRTSAIGSVQASNFTALGEPVTFGRASVNYTNFLLTATALTLSNSQNHAEVPWGQVDFKSRMVRLTNTTGCAEPALLQRLMRKNPPAFLNAVHFGVPPSVSLHGSFSLTNAGAVDMHFMVNARDLSYNKLLADNISGQVDYVGPTVTLTNIVANLYHGGTLTGWIVLMSMPGTPGMFHANLSVRKIDLPALVAGITGKTNRLEGLLEADLDLSGPNSISRSNWNGRGYAHVRSALLWDFKVFGLFSPVLNLFSPGWGYSRAHDASVDFVIDDGVFSTKNLQVLCQGFHLTFRGTVDRNNNVSARAEAILSKSLPVLGPLLGLVTVPFSKLFEYHVSGPIQNPVLEPVFVPKFITYLLHPFKKSTASPSAPDSGGRAK